MKFSVLSESYTGQPMFQYLSMAQEAERNGKTLYHFELGEPDFDTPANIVEAGVKAIRAGLTHYVPARGHWPLIEASRDVTLASRGFKPNENQLLVTPGANIQIYLALACLCNEWDSVIVPTPYFPSYVAQIDAIGATKSLAHVNPLNGYKVTAHDIASASWGLSPRVVILNSPCNPTGAVYTKSEIEDIYQVAEDLDLTIISDEVYSRMIYDGEFYSPSMIDHCKKRVVVINGFSKSFAMTGWRLGVVTGPSELIRRMTVLLESMLSCVPPFIQSAGYAALMEDQSAVVEMSKEYRRRRDVMYDALCKVKSLECQKPSGGLYFWCKIKQGTSEEYFNAAFERGVVLSPGKIFGDDEHVRLSFAGRPEDIVEGIERLESI